MCPCDHLRGILCAYHLAQQERDREKWAVLAKLAEAQQRLEVALSRLEDVGGHRDAAALRREAAQSLGRIAERAERLAGTVAK